MSRAVLPTLLIPYLGGNTWVHAHLPMVILEPVEHRSAALEVDGGRRGFRSIFVGGA